MFPLDTPTSSPNHHTKQTFGVPSYDFDQHGLPDTPTMSVSHDFDTKEFGNYFLKATEIETPKGNAESFTTSSHPTKLPNSVPSTSATNCVATVDYESTVSQVFNYITDLSIDGFTFLELASAFKDEFIDGKLFLNLTKADLNHLGCYEFAKRNKLYNHIQYLKSVVITAKPNGSRLESNSGAEKTDASSGHLELQGKQRVKQSKSLNLPPKMNTAQMVAKPSNVGVMIKTEKQENGTVVGVTAQSSQKVLFVPQQQSQQPHTAPISSLPLAQHFVNDSSTESHSFNAPNTHVLPVVKSKPYAQTVTTRRYSDIVTHLKSVKQNTTHQIRTKSESYSAKTSQKGLSKVDARKTQSHNVINSGKEPMDKFFDIPIKLDTLVHSRDNQQLVTFPAVFRDVYSDTRQANVLICKRNIDQLNRISQEIKSGDEKHAPIWDTSTISHLFYIDIQIKQKRSSNGWLVFNESSVKHEPPLNMPHYALVHVTINMGTLGITKIEPVQVPGYVRNVEYNRSPNKFDSVWVESVLSMQATEYHHYFDRKDPKSQRLQEIITLQLNNYNSQCFDNFRRGSNNQTLKQNAGKNVQDYMPLKYKNDQYSTSCLVNDVKSHGVRYQKFDKVQFCMKLAQITNMKSRAKERNVFIQAWGVQKASSH